MSNQTVCEKRELPDFILGVTVRLSKYPILIEAILKGTKGMPCKTTTKKQFFNSSIEL